MNGMKEMNEIRGMSRLGPLLARLAFVGSYFLKHHFPKKKRLGQEKKSLANKKVGSFFVFFEIFFSKKSTQKPGVS